MSSTSNEFTTRPSTLTCRKFSVGNIQIGGDAPLAILAGPCVIESEEHTLQMARSLKEICERINIPLVFKASFDKANRTSIHSFRGPGMEEGLRIFQKVKDEFNLPIITDVHEIEQAGPVAEVCDLLQIPAFLCRQTDFVLSVGKAGKPVNIKKGQFLAPWDVRNIVDKLGEIGCHDVLLTERGTSFGYGSLVTDFRGLEIMRSLTGQPVCFDGTHSVQQPGALGNATGGQREFVPLLCRAAVASGVNALFLETHDRPSEAKSDGPNMIPLDHFEDLMKSVKASDEVTGLQVQ